jgi:hypothetical protein
MVVATYAHRSTLAAKVTSYWPVPRWATPVTPLPPVSVPVLLTLAKRLLPPGAAWA